VNNIVLNKGRRDPNERRVCVNGTCGIIQESTINTWKKHEIWT